MSLPTEEEMKRIAALMHAASCIQDEAAKCIVSGFNTRSADQDSLTNRNLLEKAVGQFKYALDLMFRHADLNNERVVAAENELRSKYARCKN